MPIEVDAEQRKRDVVEAAARLIVEGGLEAVTFRNLARELRCSTTVISHYFANKSEVLRSTYLHLMSRAERRRRQSREKGLTGLVSLEEILPVGDEQWRDWVVWICFWTSALHDPKLAAEHKLRMHRAVDIIERALIEAGASGPGVAATAQAMMTVVYGIAVQAVFDREYWTPDLQRQSLRHALKGFEAVKPAPRASRTTRSAATSGVTTAMKPGATSAAKSSAKPAGKPRGKSGAKSAAKSAAGSGAKPPAGRRRGGRS